MTHARETQRTLVRLVSPGHPADDRPFWVGDKHVDPRLNQITSDGQTQRVEHQVMRVLLILASHPDKPLSREDILDNFGIESAPSDEGLTQAICKLRKALGDSPGDGRVIQTICKVGYRLVAPVTLARTGPPNRPLSISAERWGNPPMRSIRIRVSGSWLAGAALVSLTVFVAFQTL